MSKRKDQVIKPADHYFLGEGGMTEWGCLIFRECMMREVGIKSYWFDKVDGRGCTSHAKQSDTGN